MADPKQAGVGAFGDLGTHSLDILMWLLGAVDSVSADVRVITGRYGPGCDETGLAQIKFKNGVMGTLAAGWVDIANPVTLEISGTEGHAVIFRDKLYFRAKDISDAEPVAALPSAPRLPLHQFVDAIAGKAGQPLVKPAEAAARVVVMEAMYRSAKASKWTKVV
jgi:predicted dehydrogenase